MKYLILIYSNESDRADTPPAEQQQFLADYGTYTKKMQEAGVMLAGEALQPTMTASSVRVRNGETLITDGPFAETREQLGGFYMIECDTLDEAIKWGSQCPTAKTGTIEVRPLMIWDT